MRVRVVTTCHKEGWEQYGRECLEGLKKWPEEFEILWYTEGFTLPKSKRVRAIENESLVELQTFKRKHSYYRPWDWRFDVVRFANKAYAVYDALRDWDGLGIWMDADIITHRCPPKGYIEALLPQDTYIALFQRNGMHSECGLWLVDGKHPQHKAFLDTFIAWYEQGTFKQAHEWHDSVLMDSTIRAFEKRGLITVYNLSGKHSNVREVMDTHDSAKYWTHRKGPVRKAEGRKAA